MINYFSLLLPVIRARTTEILGSSPETTSLAVGAGELVRTRFSPHQHRVAKVYLEKIRSELEKPEPPGRLIQGERVEVES